MHLNYAMYAGSADVVSVECVYIADSSSLEVAQFTSPDVSQGVDPVISSIDYDLYTERLEECSVEFDAVNPLSPSYMTAVIRNYRSAVELLKI